MSKSEQIGTMDVGEMIAKHSDVRSHLDGVLVEAIMASIACAIVKHHANSCVRLEADSATRLEAGLSELIDILDRFFT